MGTTTYILIFFKINEGGDPNPTSLFEKKNTSAPPSRSATNKHHGVKFFVPYPIGGIFFTQDPF